MIERRLSLLIQIFLWVALIEDTAIFVLAWLAPELWLLFLHDGSSVGLDVALLRRAAGQWLAFALAHAITLVRWRKKPVWLAVSAGARFSDLFTDLSYVVAARSLSTLGLTLFLILPWLNLIGVVILLRGYEQARSGGRPAVRAP